MLVPAGFSKVGEVGQFVEEMEGITQTFGKRASRRVVKGGEEGKFWD